ncbi:uncharacterized protein EV154DRAFT_484475 [Mucor mucedo]|uniref:uncharacterized protein n=1 Tax=Mucor mucedo TaxID=29922 RepID=UPI0022208F08|nr:uncharacterized protein EV154DRAFT_484475 [Mucor mucedo]KAI7888073.1 hypothetical protein EV154DRAFT_484475 [Mucor mucedo]
MTGTHHQSSLQLVMSTVNSGCVDSAKVKVRIDPKNSQNVLSTVLCFEFIFEVVIIFPVCILLPLTAYFVNMLHLELLSSSTHCTSISLVSLCHCFLVTCDMIVLTIYIG